MCGLIDWLIYLFSSLVRRSAGSVWVRVMHVVRPSSQPCDLALLPPLLFFPFVPFVLLFFIIFVNVLARCRRWYVLRVPCLQVRCPAEHHKYVSRKVTQEKYHVWVVCVLKEIVQWGKIRKQWKKEKKRRVKLDSLSSTSSALVQLFVVTEYILRSSLWTRLP